MLRPVGVTLALLAASIMPPMGTWVSPMGT